MSEFLCSVLGSGPVAVLREFVQWLVKIAGPLWNQLVAFLSQMYEDLSNQYEQEQDRAAWGRPELGWDS